MISNILGGRSPVAPLSDQSVQSARKTLDMGAALSFLGREPPYPSTEFSTHSPPPPSLARRQTSAFLVSPGLSASWPSNLQSAGSKVAGSCDEIRRLSVWRGGASSEGGVGILVHGCHLQADGWEEIVWGLPPDQLGRLPHAALLAWEERDSLACVCFGTGASQASDGTFEGKYTLSLLLDRIPRLSEFAAFDGVDVNELEALLRRCCVAETTSQNTVEEVRAGLAMFASKGCRRAVLVSSPTHLPRCLACACQVDETEPTLFGGSVWASPCDTSYKGFSGADVVVVEPPHRGDRDRALDDLPFHSMVRRSYKVQGERRSAFLKEFEALLQDYGV